MLNKSQTLKTKEVKYTAIKGKKLDAPNLFAKFIPSEEYKLAVNVSKKIHKKAVVRNRIKRRIKAAWLSIEEKKVGKYVINAKRVDIAEMQFEMLKEEMQMLIA